MKYFFLVAVVLTGLSYGVLAQPPRVPGKVTPRNVPFKTVTEISTDDWLTLAKALEKEDWNLSSSLTAEHLKTLKTDNEKKQLAQVRYLYLFALAGQILENNARGNGAEAEKAMGELDLAIERMIGKELLLPPRPFSRDCAKKLNVICPSKDTPNAFRVTATNQEGSGIHSFDWVTFAQPVDIKEFEGKTTFLGGTLRRVEFNEDKTKPWVIRLYMNEGNLRVVVK